MSLQIRAKLQKFNNRLLNRCKLEVILKIQNKLCNNFYFKDPCSPAYIACGLQVSAWIMQRIILRRMC